MLDRLLIIIAVHMRVNDVPTSENDEKLQYDS